MRLMYSVLGLFAIVTSACACALAGDTSSVKPGEPAATATIRCIGVMWPVEGDENGSARCAVQYREAGATGWRDALPLHRKPPVEVDIEKSMAGPRYIPFLGGLKRWDKGTRQYALDHWAANYLAGSIFDLKPGTSYEIRLTLSDPDGGLSVEKAITAKTRTEPVMPSEGTKVDVTPADGPKALANAFELAKPGDVILVHKGLYQGPFTISASGTAEKPIVIRAAGDGPAVIRGKGYIKEGDRRCLQIDGSHIFIDGLAFDDAVTAVNIGPGRFTEKSEWERLRAAGEVQSDIVITRCKTTRTQYAIVGTADRCYIADNDLNGLAADVPGIDWSEGEGVEIHGSGTEVCYNRMFHLSDGVSVYDFTDNQDVYNNDIFSCSDDSIELDYSDANNRVFDNRFWFAANNSVSFQPTIGGPAYVFRNEVFGSREGCCKDRYGSSDVYFFNNTFFSHMAVPGMAVEGRRFVSAPFDMPMIAYSRNNLYLMLGGTDDPAVNVHPTEPPLHSIDMDYDGLGGPFMIEAGYGAKDIDPATYPGSRYVTGVGLVIPIDSFRKVAGTLEHYTLVDPAKLFAEPLPRIRDWRLDEPRPLLVLKEGSNAIDAGTGVPGVTDGFVGKAPDLGAHEFGAPVPHYGPRAAAAPAVESTAPAQESTVSF